MLNSVEVAEREERNRDVFIIECIQNLSLELEVNKCLLLLCLPEV